MMTVVSPARCAASTFIFTPPTGSTRPRSVISPVMPTSWRTGRAVKRLTMAVTMATPADGPSLGMAPAGAWGQVRVPARRVSPPEGVDLPGHALLRLYDDPRVAPKEPQG